MSGASLRCVSCERDLPTRDFRGARFKAKACVKCEALHVGERWCFDCAAWLPEDRFYVVGAGKKFQTFRCKPCKVLYSHGVNKTYMAELTGLSLPACGACGAGGRLSIDHDHGHCSGERGCRLCVRGYLCRSCNTAEGLLRTPERAKALAEYMEANRLTDEQLAQMGPSPKVGPRTRRAYAGAPRKWYEHAS